MDYSVQRLQFLDLTDATENDQSLIERVLFSSNQVLDLPWCTGESGTANEEADREWGSPTYSDVENRQELQGNRASVGEAEVEGEQCGREEESEEGSPGDPRDQGPQQEQLPRQGGIFPGHPPTSMPHQAQPMFQMYQMVPSLSNVYVSNVTANVNVHTPYVPPIPTHYGHQMPPQQQQQQPPPQQMYPHAPPEGDQGSRNRRQRQKTDKKREGPFVQTAEVLSPSLENHPPPQFPNIHPMPPYYIPGAPGAPVYMQHAVLPVYPSPMFNPYGHSPGPIVYPQANSLETGNEEYHDNVQQNFHQGGPEMVVVGCGMRQENGSQRGVEGGDAGYPMEEQQEQMLQDASGFKPENVQSNAESSAEPQFQNGEHSSGKEEGGQPGGVYFERKGGPPEGERSGGQPEAPPGQQTTQCTNSRKSDSTAVFHGDVLKKGNSEVDVNNLDSVSAKSNSSAPVWGEERGGRGGDGSKEKANIGSAQVVTEMNVQKTLVPVSQNNDFPLIGEKSAVVSPEATSIPNQPTPSSAGKSWASLFNTPDQFTVSPMSDNRGRPLARVLPYHEGEGSTSGPIPSAPAQVKPERIPPLKANGPHPKDSVPHSDFVNDPHLHNLGVFLCNYELEHKIVSLQPRGLTNRSNWCYVNAILQSLIACPPFYNLLKALPVTKKGNKQTLIMDALVEYANEFSLLPANARIGKREKSARNKEESNVVEIMAGPSFEPSGIYKILDKVRGESSFNVEGRQEDAEEFLSCLLNGLNDEMFELMKIVDANKPILTNGEANGSLEGSQEDDDSEWNVMGPKNKSSVTRRAVCGKTPISDIFRGQFRSRVQRAGDQSTDTVQPFFTLQLDIEKASSVKDALELFMGRDPLEGVTCSRTHQEVEAWTQTTLEDLPLVLILHLKCYDYKSDACSKIIKSVDFQVDLKIDAKLLSNRNKYTGKQRNYKLVAVVYHDGKEASKGHYVTDAYHVGYGCWLRYDDVIVRSVPESHVLKPRAPRVPYLLYYRRTDTIGPTK